MTKKFIPDLDVDKENPELGEALGIRLDRIPDASNEIAAILVSNDFALRSCGAALARVLGWLAFQSQAEIEPREFLKAVSEQSLNYCTAFAARSKHK